MALLSFLGCNNMFYLPSREVYSVPKGQGKPDDVFFSSDDGVRLHGWLFRSRGMPSKGIVVHFHGNAENVTTHYAAVEWLADSGFDVFTFDYRGYGRSEGRADYDGIRRDGIAALRHALDLMPDKPLILYGQSLGGAIALRALGDLDDRSRILAVISEASFSSYRKMAREALKSSLVLWPVQWLAYVLISDRHGPASVLPELSPVPVLVLHGERDRVVPISMGRELFARSGEPKTLWTFPHADHLDILWNEGKPFQQRLLTFLDAALQSASE